MNLRPNTVIGKIFKTVLTEAPVSAVTMLLCTATIKHTEPVVVQT